MLFAESCGFGLDESAGADVFYLDVVGHADRVTYGDRGRGLDDGDEFVLGALLKPETGTGNALDTAGSDVVVTHGAIELEAVNADLEVGDERVVGRACGGDGAVVVPYTHDEPTVHCGG